MQVYGRGLRRRLPPMLDGDPRRIRMVYSLLFSLPGHAGAVLRRGDRHGREPRRRGPHRGAHADAVDARAGTAASPTAPPSRLAGPGRRGRLRARARQRRGPAARPRLAAGLHDAARPALPRVPRARLGRRSRCSTSRSAAVLAHRCDLGRRVDSSRVHNLSAEAVHRAAAARRTATSETRLVDLLRGRRSTQLDAPRPRSSCRWRATATAGCGSCRRAAACSRRGAGGRG